MVKLFIEREALHTPLVATFLALVVVRFVSKWPPVVLIGIFPSNHSSLEYAFESRSPSTVQSSSMASPGETWTVSPCAALLGLLLLIWCPVAWWITYIASGYPAECMELWRSTWMLLLGLSFTLNFSAQSTRRNGSARPRVQVEHLPSAWGVGRTSERRREYKATFHTIFMCTSLAVWVELSISLLEVRALSCLQ